MSLQWLYAVGSGGGGGAHLPPASVLEASGIP